MHYQDALALARRVAPEGDLIVEIERRRAEALCAVGRLDEAERACATALRLAADTNDRLEQAVAQRAAGAISMERGPRSAALHSWIRAAGQRPQYRRRCQVLLTLIQ